MKKQDVKRRSFQGISFYIAWVGLAALIELLNCFKAAFSLDESVGLKWGYFAIIVAFLVIAILLLKKQSSVFDKEDFLSNILESYWRKKE